MKIHEAAAKGDKDAVLRELEAGVPVDVTDEGVTPLMVAVSCPESNLETVQLLLQRGANPNAIGGELDDPVLAYALQSSDLVRLECLLDAGADITFINESGYDALIWSAHCSDEHLLDIIDLLIRRGAPVMGETEYSESALSICSNRGRFDVVKRLLDAGADASRLQWSPLIYAIALGTAEDVREQLQQGASLEDRDFWERTPWLFSLSVGDIEKANLILEAGAERDDVGRCGKTPLIYPIETENLEMLRWLLEIGCDPNATDEFGGTALMEAAEQGFADAVQLLLDAGADTQMADHIGQKAIEHANTVEVVRLLVAVGEDLNDLNSTTRALLLDLEDEGELVCTREEFEAGRLRRFGKANPEKMDIPFWDAMVRSGVSAYTPHAMFVPESEMYSEVENENPVWCYKRFGKSITELPDGRFIEIGGEHEDWYDRDFCIYNEVFVHTPSIGIDIYGYPQDVFPPTDFHSATFVDGFIYVIGCLGYPDQRIEGETPVYRLNTETLAIEKIETSGENPGWIFRHKATLAGEEIHISGGDVWPDSPEESERKAAEREQMMAFPNKDDYESEDDWIAAVSQHLDENKIEEYEHPERFALNLKTLQWRRLAE